MESILQWPFARRLPVGGSRGLRVILTLSESKHVSRGLQQGRECVCVSMRKRTHGHPKV